MVLQRNERIVIVVNTRVLMLFNECAVGGILAEPILAQANRARVPAADLRVYLPRRDADATALGAR